MPHASCCVAQDRLSSPRRRALRGVAAARNLADIDAAGDLAAIARASAPAEPLGVEYEHIAPAFRQRQRAVNTGIPPTNYQYIDGARQFFRRLRWGRAIGPPPRCCAKIS